MTSRIKISVFLILMTAIGSFFRWSNADGQSDSAPVAVPVRTSSVQTNDASSEILFTGVTRGVNSADIAFQVSGRASIQAVEIGQKVDKGDLLLVLDNPDIKPMALAALERTKAARAAENLAKQDFARIERLVDEKAATQQEFDQVKARFAEAQAELLAAEANQNALQRRADELELTAPFSGVITAIEFDLGEMIIPGKPVLSMLDPSVVELELSVSPAVLDNISLGDLVKVRSALRSPLLENTGKVVHKSPYTSKGNLPQLIIQLEDATIPPGEAVEIIILMPRSEHIQVPVSAVFRVSDGSTGVYVVAEDIAELIPVIPLELIDDQVLVIGDLHTDQAVVIEGVSKLFDGAKVEIL